MSQPVCRVGDCIAGRCEVLAPDHPRDFIGVWVTGSDVLDSEGSGTIRVGDIGITDCGHTILAVEGSSNVDGEGLPMHRVGDAVIIVEEGGGYGISITGSDTTNFN